MFLKPILPSGFHRQQPRRMFVVKSNLREDYQLQGKGGIEILCSTGHIRPMSYGLPGEKLT